MSDGHILLIEDDPDLRLTLTDALQRAGYQVTTAASVRDARAVIAGFLVNQINRLPVSMDLVLLDLTLPDGAGNLLLPTIQRELQAPVVVISARHEDDSKIGLLDQGLKIIWSNLSASANCWRAYAQCCAARRN